MPSVTNNTFINSRANSLPVIVISIEEAIVGLSQSLVKRKTTALHRGILFHQTLLKQTFPQFPSLSAPFLQSG